MSSVHQVIHVVYPFWHIRVDNFAWVISRDKKEIRLRRHIKPHKMLPRPHNNWVECQDIFSDPGRSWLLSWYIPLSSKCVIVYVVTAGLLWLLSKMRNENWKMSKESVSYWLDFYYKLLLTKAVWHSVALYLPEIFFFSASRKCKKFYSCKC